VVCVRSAGMVETPSIQQVFGGVARTVRTPKDALLEAAREKTLLKCMPKVVETAEIVAFVASDHASALTGAIINSSSGEISD